MNRLKTFTFGLLASGTILITFNICVFPSQAQAVPGGSESLPEGEMKITCPIECEPWPEELELTDEQMEKLVDLRLDYEIKIAEKEAQLMSNMKQMALLMTSTKTDKEAIMALNGKTNSLRADLDTARVQKMIAAMDIMTPKQKEQIHHRMLVHMLSHHQMDIMKHHGAKKYHH
jgi:Spy/CpxP family protein refolding chaperone